MVLFHKSEQGVYAFDTWQEHYKNISLINNKNLYEHLGSYNVSCKLVPPGKTDVVSYELQVSKAGGIDTSKLVFKTGAGITLSHNAARRELTLNGGNSNDAQDVFALYPDANGGYQMVGKLKVLSYSERTFNLVLVPVNGNRLDANAISTYLNRDVFNPLGISWSVSQDADFSYPTSDITSEGGSGFLSSYTDEMKALNAAYKSTHSISKNTLYLFVLNNGNISGIDPGGFMPRGKQFGYLFTGSGGGSGWTVAHEAGHGLFRLQHTFDGEYGSQAQSMQGQTDNLMDYGGGTHLAKWQWDEIFSPALLVNPFEGDEDGMAIAADYFGQSITRPDGKNEKTHQSALCILNGDEQTISYILPNGDTFIWVDDGTWKGYFLDGVARKKDSYQYYIQDQYNRQKQPVAWGIYLAASDLGGFVMDFVSDPVGTTQSFAKGIIKIATLQFDIGKTWDRILSADITDASYVAASVALAYLSGPKGKGLVAAEDASKFREVLEEVATQSKSQKLSWSEVLDLFRKGKAFEGTISSHLAIIYPRIQGFTVFNQVYLKVDGVISIADNIIFDSRNAKFILNETKYGVTNTLRKNQQVLVDAVKAGKKVEIRSVGRFIDVNDNIIFSQGSEISISKILRSHSTDGAINSNTVKTIWP